MPRHFEEEQRRETAQTRRKTGVNLFGALGIVGVTLALSLSASAHATEPADAATAQALFDEAKALMQAKDFAAACPKLEQSQAIQPGGGTLLFLALCREGEGKTASAWVTYNAVLSMAKRDNRPDREKVAAEHLETLVPRLSRLSVEVPSPVRAPGLEVRRDGEVLPSASWGTAIPIDPGSHTVRATADGMVPWETKVDAPSPGTVQTVVVPPLVPAPHVETPAPAPAPAPTLEPPGLPAQRIAALVVGGAGIVGLGVGAVFGATALAKKNDPGATAWDDGNVSSVALGVGAAAVVGGGVLWLLTPKPKVQAGWIPRATIDAHSASLGVSRTW
jgi:hypothetical protein